MRRTVIRSTPGLWEGNKMKIGIIGGSGLYEMEGLEKIEEKELETPFGEPSDAYISGILDGVEVFFLPRHGRGHRILPSEINHRANIYGFKMLGVQRIAAVTAVGSLKEEIRPRDIVLPDQFFDRTKKSLEHTFFGEGIVAHVSFGDPACPDFRRAIADAAGRALARQDPESGVKLIEKGTYVNMEGPAFSTRAESNVYRSFGFDIIGMTSLGEAKLCREAEICYQTIAMVTDYDCWRESEEPVTTEIVVGHLIANTAMAKDILKELIPSLQEERSCSCGSALAGSILTSPEAISGHARKKLPFIIDKYVK